jgi:LysM repeat protein
VKTMSIYNKYSIEVNLIPNLPVVDFRNGKAEGVVMHATATYNDTPDGERNFEVGHYNSAFVHTFTDENKILQVASFLKGAYGAGSTANHRYLHNELCQDYDNAKFLAGYDRWIWLAARQLYDLGLAPKDNSTLFSHQEITNDFHESTHSDPIDYLKSHGKTWGNVVSDVTSYYNQMYAEKHPSPAPTPSPVALTYTVKSGDTLWGISKQFGVPVATIKTLNGLTSDTIQVGQVLRLASSAPTPTPQPTPPQPKPNVNGIPVVGYIQIVNVANACFICDRPSSTNSKNLGTAARGTKLPISGSVPNWYEVIYNGKRAYVNQKYGKRI